MRLVLFFLLLLPQIGISQEHSFKLSPAELDIISIELFGKTLPSVSISNTDLASTEINKFINSYNKLEELASRPLTKSEQVSFIKMYLDQMPLEDRKFVLINIKNFFLAS